ncbi:MAG: TrkA family potassium uptake protein [Mycoplasma sp.]|nr:TrkA family potassium uptake protein [Mycoplasma sp.]
MFSKNKNKIAIIGAGRFGISVTEELAKKHVSTLVMDISSDALYKISKIASQTAVIDASDPDALLALGVPDFDVVIVATGNNIDIVAALGEIGVNKTIVKAISTRNARILKQIGVNVIIRPEIEAGAKAAILATNEKMRDYTSNVNEIGEGFAIAQIEALNSDVYDRKIMELDFRKLKVNIVSLKRNGKIFLPEGNSKIQKNDIVNLVGRLNDLSNAASYLGDESKKVKDKK